MPLPVEDVAGGTVVAAATAAAPPPATTTAPFVPPAAIELGSELGKTSGTVPPAIQWLINHMAIANSRKSSLPSLVTSDNALQRARRRRRSRSEREIFLLRDGVVALSIAHQILPSTATSRPDRDSRSFASKPTRCNEQNAYSSTEFFSEKQTQNSRARTHDKQRSNISTGYEAVCIAIRSRKDGSIIFHFCLCHRGTGSSGGASTRHGTTTSRRRRQLRLKKVIVVVVVIASATRRVKQTERDANYREYLQHYAFERRNAAICGGGLDRQRLAALRTIHETQRLHKL
jgi:hypothetical protein